MRKTILEFKVLKHKDFNNTYGYIDFNDGLTEVRIMPRNTSFWFAKGLFDIDSTIESIIEQYTKIGNQEFSIGSLKAYDLITIKFNPND
jgi:hypothetical protein